MKHYAILLCTMLAACGGSQTPAPGVVNPPPVVSQLTAPPVITQTPPPVVQTDDTATLQALLDKGDLEQLEGRTYHTTHALIATRSGATLRGQAGTVIEFQSPPVGTLRDPGVNDRVFGIGGSVSTTTQLPIAKAISVGDTSFEAFYAADVANIVPGDWVIITVNDPGIADENTHLGYPTYVDWEQVTAVDGTTVHVATPFRMAFTNTLAFVTNSSGLGFVRVNLTQNVTLEDLTIQVDPGAPVVGVYVLGTLNTTLSEVEQPKAPVGPTLQDIKDKVNELLQANLREQAIALFASYNGAKNASGVPATAYADFIAKADEILMKG